jgi:hypothetical protein
MIIFNEVSIIHSHLGKNCQHVIEHIAAWHESEAQALDTRVSAAEEFATWLTWQLGWFGKTGIVTDS